MIDKVLARETYARVAAVILALIVWVQVINDKNPLERRTFNFEIQVDNLGSTDLTVVEVSPDRVAVTLEGRARTLASINPQKIKVHADVSKLGPGRSTIPLKFDAPYGLRVIEINPKSVTVDLDVVVAKQVPVTVGVRGVPNEDYEVGQPVPGLTAARVSGPRRYLERVQSVYGEVDVTGASSQVVARVTLSPRDSAGNVVENVTVEPRDVQVTVPVNALPPSKTVPVRVNMEGTPRAGYKVKNVTVKPDSVKFRADPQTVKAVESIFTDPVDVSGRDSSFGVTVGLDIPAGVQWMQSTEVTVWVEIAEDISERTYSKVPVLLDPPPAPGYRWEMDRGEVDVVLRGRSDILAQIAKNDIEAYIDAGGRSEGTYKLLVAVRVPSSFASSVDVKSITPSYVTLTLTRR